MEALKTEVKNNLVNALNWVVDKTSGVIAKLGSADISKIGDGTVTGAIVNNKEAIEDVSQSLTYKKIATLSGATAQSIDFTKYKEILLIAFVRGGYCSMVIPTDILTADEQWFNLNYNDVNLNVAAMSFKISKTSARIYQLTYSTTDYTAKAVAQIYAK